MVPIIAPMNTSIKGSTIVAREGLLSQLKKKFNKKIDKHSILNEDVIIDEDK